MEILTIGTNVYPGWRQNGAFYLLSLHKNNTNYGQNKFVLLSDFEVDITS